jgi:hypothetical protein
MKNVMKLAGRFLLLWVLYAVATMISGRIAGTEKFFPMTQEQQMAAGAGLLAVGVFYAAVLLYIMERSAWRGLKLLAAVFGAYVGITIFLTQIESLVFLIQLVNIIPKGALPVMILDNTIAAVIFCPLAVLASGKMKGPEDRADMERLKMDAVEWAIKFLLLGVIYYFVYTLFGRYVMLPIAGMEAFNAYYKDLHMPGWMPLFQIGRGMVWAAIAVPVILMFKGGKVETGFAVAVLFSVFMGINLIIPLPFMPEKIRIAHLAEVMTSNFLFGWIVVFVLVFQKKAA